MLNLMFISYPKACHHPALEQITGMRFWLAEMGHYGYAQGFRLGGFLPSPLLKAKRPGIRVTENPSKPNAMSRHGTACKNSSCPCFYVGLLLYLMQSRIPEWQSVSYPFAELFNLEDALRPPRHTRSQSNDKGKETVSLHRTVSGDWEKGRNGRTLRSPQDENVNAGIRGRKVCSIFRCDTSFLMRIDSNFDHFYSYY